MNAILNKTILHVTLFTCGDDYQGVLLLHMSMRPPSIEGLSTIPRFHYHGEDYMQLMMIAGMACFLEILHSKLLMNGDDLQSLALAHTDIKDDGVFFSPWKETDFRTNEKPWWI